MSDILTIDNFIIDVPLIDIINDLRVKYPSHKLNIVKTARSEIVLTCVNSEHAGGCEQHPDAHINLDSTKALYGWYHCFACQTSCSFIGFVALYFDNSIEYAKQWLITNYGKKSYEKQLSIEPINISKQTKQQFLDKKILDTYQEYCPYLAKRKISLDTCKLFNVKYDSKYRQIVFPVYDKAGNLLMMPKRSIDTKTFYLDKSVAKPVYGLNYILNNNITTCLITEGPIDLLTAYEYGFPAIATLGALSDTQIAQINNSCITTLYLCMDNDIAGIKFRDTLIKKLDKRIMAIPVNFPANKKDINDLTKDELTSCLKAAKESQIL